MFTKLIKLFLITLTISAQASIRCPHEGELRSILKNPDMYYFDQRAQVAQATMAWINQTLDFVKRHKIHLEPEDHEYLRLMAIMTSRVLNN